MKIGIDLGGSHIAIGVVDENGRIIEKQERRILDKEKQEIKTFYSQISGGEQGSMYKIRAEDGTIFIHLHWIKERKMDFYISLTGMMKH